MTATVRAGTATLLVLLALLCVSPRAPVAVTTLDTLPDRLSDQAFWRLVEELSEAGGSFRSDNLISNEDTFQRAIPELERRLPPGGAYLGVGPDQNFTYLAATRPKIAFVIDIRRQNMLLHLMYKALIELSADRAELLSRLFSRPRPAGLSADSTARQLFDAYAAVPSDPELFGENLGLVRHRLEAIHRFRLSAGDMRTLDDVYRAFYAGGPELRYAFPRPGFGGRFFPSYAELMLETDTQGVQRSYLATERNYRVLREYEFKNLLVPVVGDFAGERALRSIGRFLKDHGGVVRLFYTSNVEQYLFQNGDAWRRFFGNVAALPLDESSTFLRSHFNLGFGMRYAAPIAPTPFPGRSAMLLDTIPAVLEAVREGRMRSYYDLIEHSRQSATGP